MTREEFDKQSDLCFSAQEHVFVCKGYIDSIEQQNTALQARIKDLEEPKKCDGCKWHLSDNGIYPIDPCCTCRRFNIDYYEPKQNQ